MELNLYQKIVAKICTVTGVLGMISIGIMACLTTSDVIMRYVFIKPITGATETVQCLWILSSLTLGMTALAQEHTQIDILTKRLPRGVQRILHAVTMVVSTCLCFMIAYSVYDNMLYSRKFRVKLGQTDIMEWWPMLLFAIAFFVLGLACVSVIMTEWRALSKKEPAPEEAHETQKEGQ